MTQKQSIMYAIVGYLFSLAFLGAAIFYANEIITAGSASENDNDIFFGLFIGSAGILIFIGLVLVTRVITRRKPRKELDSE
ncbi:MAG: hypothetical protein HQK84_12600 [Nitrospinae bacterium]|nr:hypothetical protein [Nitrospinota bacterium]